MNAAEHKRLLVDQKRLNKYLAELRVSIINSEARIKSAEKEVARIQKRLDEATQIQLIVSEHAILRYLERVRDINLQSVEWEILRTAQAAGIIDDGEYSLGFYRVRIKDGIIITVLV